MCVRLMLCSCVAWCWVGWAYDRVLDRALIGRFRLGAGALLLCRGAVRSTPVGAPAFDVMQSMARDGWNQNVTFSVAEAYDLTRMPMGSALLFRSGFRSN